MRALLSTNNNNTTILRRERRRRRRRHDISSASERAQSTIGVPPRQKKNDRPPATILEQHPSSRFGVRNRTATTTTTVSKARTNENYNRATRSTNGRETAPPIAPRLKPREPPVLAKYPPTATAQGRKRDQQVLVRGPARTKTPSSSLLVTSTSTAAGGRKMTRTTTMTTSTVFGRQNGTEKQRQETIGTKRARVGKTVEEKNRRNERVAGTETNAVQRGIRRRRSKI